METERIETRPVHLPKKEFAAVKRVFHIVLLLCILLAVTALSILTVPRLAGFGVYSIQSDSMKPTLPVGTLIFVKQTSFESINVGDICTFQSKKDSNKRFTHTVIGMNAKERTLSTKGDASSYADPEPTPYENMLGRVEWHIHYLGWPILLLEKPWAQLTVGILLLLWLAAEIEFATSKRRTRKNKQSALSDSES